MNTQLSPTSTILLFAMLLLLIGLILIFRYMLRTSNSRKQKTTVSSPKKAQKSAVDATTNLQADQRRVKLAVRIPYWERSLKYLEVVDEAKIPRGQLKEFDDLNKIALSLAEAEASPQTKDVSISKEHIVIRQSNMNSETEVYVCRVGENMWRETVDFRYTDW